MGFPALMPDEVASDDDAPVLREHGFHERTPLCYYVLKEAEVRGNGQRLGAVGSKIVAKVFEGDPTSFVAADPSWKPTLPAPTPGPSTTADLLRFVNNVNPVGSATRPP